jgi:Dickkopf N-terminal cysteine-rich region
MVRWILVWVGAALSAGCTTATFAMVDAGDDGGAPGTTGDPSGSRDAASSVVVHVGGESPSPSADASAACTSAADCPSLSTSCLTATCSSGLCGASTASVGAACDDHGGSVCDGDGHCVECNSAGDCSDSDACISHTCVAPGSTQGGGGNCGAGGTPCGNGDGCTEETDCASGFCVDGVCCNVACTAGCMACSAADKGSGSDGVCGPVAKGTDPGNSCTDEGAASCGDNGLCDGAGACDSYSVNAVCGAASCGSGSAMPAAHCNGSGTCVAASPVACAPYTGCTGDTCATSCVHDSDCTAGHYCDVAAGGSGACVATLATGGACTAPDQCATGSCANGVCCSSACTGNCSSCDLPGSVGTCTDVPNGQTNPAHPCPDGGTCALGFCPL